MNPMAGMNLMGMAGMGSASNMGAGGMPATSSKGLGEGQSEDRVYGAASAAEALLGTDPGGGPAWKHVKTGESLATPAADSSEEQQSSSAQKKMQASIQALSEQLDARQRDGKSLPHTGRGAADDASSSGKKEDATMRQLALLQQQAAPGGDEGEGSRGSPGGGMAAQMQQAQLAMMQAMDSAATGSESADPRAQQLQGVWAAQQAQYMQQYQFYQQMQVQEVQRAVRSRATGTQPSRFKESFRPMRLCKHLITFGFCRQGKECTFGHTYDELHPASPDLPQDMAGTSALAEQGEIEESSVPDMRLKKKKEMCGRFSRGECSLGKICPFAHSENEIGTVGLAVCGKVKTRLCVFWDSKTQTAKGCIYGKNCNNAHGEREIGMKRPPPELAPPTKRRREGESVIAGRE